VGHVPPIVLDFGERQQPQRQRPSGTVQRSVSGVPYLLWQVSGASVGSGCVGVSLVFSQGWAGWENSIF